MTTNQPSATAPVPVAPGQSLDLTNPGLNQPAVAAAAEKIEWTGKLTIGRFTYDLVPVLPAITMVKLQQAQDSGQFLQIIEAIPRLVVHGQREQLRTYLLADPEDQADVVTLDDVVEALNNGLEQITNRPTDK